MHEPFSIKEVVVATQNFSPREPAFLTASDGIKLGFYPFVPEQPRAAIISYHGGGAWTKPMYQLMGDESAKRHAFAMYLFDIRGHGHSTGARGDAPSSKQVWDDIDAAFDFVKKKHPNLPIFLAGHSSGAGLIINYGAHTQEQKADGYIFIAPFLGTDAGTDIKYPEPEKAFVSKARGWALIGHGLSKGALFAHTPAVFFNYSDLQKSDPLLLSYYTSAMSFAVFPHNVKELISKINKPCALFIGKQDERFDPAKVVAYKEFFQNKEKAIAKIVPDANHLSIVLQAPSLFDETITLWS